MSAKEKFQKGTVSLFLTIMIMILSLAMILGLTAIFVGQIRIIKGMGDSVTAFYAANTGIEKLLYKDKLCHQQSPPCVSPCRPDCLGLVLSYKITETLANGASYSAKASLWKGQAVFQSLGVFRGARRAISVSR